MKPVSTKIQKIIAFIPFVNRVMFVIWVYNHMIEKKPWADFIKAAIAFLCSATLVLLGLRFVSLWHSEVSDTLSSLGLYLICLIWGMSLIHIQESN